jgi:hypothetical protein
MNALVVAGALQALAVAIWLMPASVHIVEWSGSRAERVAYLPSFPPRRPLAGRRAPGGPTTGPKGRLAPRGARPSG